jgi:hypothetical protein
LVYSCSFIINLFFIGRVDLHILGFHTLFLFNPLLFFVMIRSTLPRFKL